MIRGLFTAASGLGVQQARIDVLSNNIANISTNGFKQDSVISKQFPEMLLLGKSQENLAGRKLSRWAPVGRTNQGVAVAGVVTDHSPGVLQETGRYTDLALAGKGFFTVQTGDGRVFYTRDGQFHTDSRGYLVDSRGGRVLTDNGPALVGSTEFKVNAKGEITLADGTTFKLKVVDFDNPQELVKEGNNYLSAPSGGGAEAANPGVTQGYLERSNVDLASQMVNMVEVLRVYEAGQKLIQAHDELLGTVINQVGTVK